MLERQPSVGRSQVPTGGQNIHLALYAWVLRQASFGELCSLQTGSGMWASPLSQERRLSVAVKGCFEGILSEGGFKRVYLKQ